ncbi:hypothetical protein F5Y09DRAFT_251143 [Xylaria sp. FL1042]|nr:hypothetical protein F5Y09DRAFT_251143 [Xylaria sp. FL1042]
MALDPLTALSVVSSTIQLADFMIRTISSASEIYRSSSGCSSSVSSIEAISLNLLQLTDNISKATGAYSELPDWKLPTPRISQAESFKRIVHTARLCSAEARNLNAVLAKLKTNKNTIWKSFRLALMTVMSKDKIDGLFATIMHLQGSLVGHLQFELLNSQSELRQILNSIQLQANDWQSSFGRTLQEIYSNLQDHLKYKACHLLGNTEEAEELAQQGLLVPDSIRNDISNHMQQVYSLLQSLVPETKVAISQSRFLNKLRFRTMVARRDGIADAHAMTFKWISQRPDTENKSISGFSRWIEGGDKVFWISGKAGSGKSTLMKFLVRCPLIRRGLARWAASQKLVTSVHFFWSAGSSLQKSQEGLLRTILFDILRQCPEHIDMIQHTFELDDELQHWNNNKLVSAIKLAIQESGPTRFCFFLDGLDEFEGDHELLIGLVTDLTSSMTNVKICVSSRPWTCFRDALGQDPKMCLKLEEFTANDIGNFVRNKLSQDRRLKRHMIGHNPSETIEYLVNEVVAKAEGVFLWVSLVVESLLQGLKYGDRESDLKRRLDSLPPTLEGMFSHILKSVDPFYKKQTAETLLVASCASSALSLVLYTAIDDIDYDNTRLASIWMNISPHGIEEIKDRMLRRLDGRSKGLLEVRHNRFGPDGAFYAYNVEFLHRTVRDFLLTKEMSLYLSRDARAEFDPNAVLAQAYLTMLKSPLMGHSDQFLKKMLDRFMYHVSRIRSRHNGQATTLMEMLRQILPDSSPVWSWRMGHNAILLAAIELHMIDYIDLTMTLNPTLGRTQGGQFLGYALDQTTSCSKVSTGVSTQMVELLLRHHSSPNDILSNTTRSVWVEFLGTLRSNIGKWNEILGLNRDQVVEIVVMLLTAGASLEDGGSILRGIFSKFETEEIIQRARDDASLLERRVTLKPSDRNTPLDRRRNTKSGSGGLSTSKPGSKTSSWRVEKRRSRGSRKHTEGKRIAR